METILDGGWEIRDCFLLGFLSLSSFTVTEEPRPSLQSLPLTIPTSQCLCQCQRQLQFTETRWYIHLQSLCRAQGWCPHNIAWSCLLSLSPGLTATVIANRMSLLEVWLLRGERAPSAISILDVRSVISLVPCHLLSQTVSGCNYSA